MRSYNEILEVYWSIRILRKTIVKMYCMGKRTNIGMELIIEPQVLFLDEPTTGLDAFTAVSVIQLLKK